MPSFDEVTREDVINALSEYDARGADDFLAHYGFGAAREYVLWYGGRDYASKAILGVANKYATGTAALRSEFSGGKDGAARHLRELGFEVTYVDRLGVAEEPATGSWREASDVGSDAARTAWAEAAREVLLDAACRYHGIVTYKQLATQVQHRTGIRTKQLMHYWIGDVLGRVAEECSRREEPLLSALCVNAEGSVGTGYAVAVLATSGETPSDADDHAAAQRLACYRHYDAIGLPPDGGTATLTPKLAAARARAHNRRSAERPGVSCPTCHMQLPATGICDECA